ncbi:MAG: carboxypeptidase-like regulatory domain-containing protein [Phycisphaerae bacterium]
MQKRVLLSAVLIFIVVQICFAESSLLSKSDAGTITGKVIDAKDKPVAGVVVILCEQSSGIPVCKETFRLFTDVFLTKEGNQQKEIYFVVTDVLGCFSFEKVPVGEYRLVAQSWKDVEEFKGIFEKNGKEIQLHGIAEHVRVSAENSPNIVLRPLGTGVLQINEDAPNDETLLVISSSPTRADPILGFAGWGGAFMQNMIGGNRMPKGKTTVYGLSEGKVYLAMFAADSVPGWTEGQAQITPNTTTVIEYIPFVNSWSNSRHDPPEHLVPVFEEVKRLISRKDNFIFNLYQNSDIQIDRSKGMWGFMEQIGPHLAKEVELPSGSKATFGEVMAAAQYVQLQRTMERKKEQWKKHDEAMKKFLDRRAAKKAMAQKEQVRIRETVDISSPSSFFPDDVQAGEELDELWEVKNHAFNTVSSEEILKIVRKGFRRTSAKKDDIIGTIGSKFVWHKRPSVQSAVDILYCASFEPDVKYNAFYYGLTVAKPKSPEVLKRLVELAMQGYGVGRIAWGILVVQNQREEFVNLLKPYLNSNDSTERQQAQNVMRVIEGKSSGVYSTGIGETNPEDIEKVKKDFGDKLGQIKQTLLTGTSSLRLMELERICSLNTCILFDDTFISGIQACAQDKSPKVRIKTAEVAGYYWIWGDTITNPKITRLLIQLSEDEFREVRFATVEKGLFNIPNKTEGIIKRIVDITLAEQKEIPEKLYLRIQYVLRVNGNITRTILQEYLNEGEYEQGIIARLYRDALRSEPPIVEKK